MKAYIPAAQIEKTGIIRHVPANISNKKLYCKLSSMYEIIAVRRFIKKVGHERVPLQTLQQCYRCFKFNHSAKVCNGKQRCSICSGEHFYKDCNKPNELNCANCSGPHLAISNLCPVKVKKIQEKKSKVTYASTAATNNTNMLKDKIYEEQFPTLVHNKHLQGYVVWFAIPKRLLSNSPETQTQSTSPPIPQISTNTRGIENNQQPTSSSSTILSLLQVPAITDEFKLSGYLFSSLCQSLNRY
ncbi:hypothetical protein evm_011963 [Chilo suppressalis]|nr:hypothetical protein evm_011963 [Chilo suppressalis]